MAEEK
jgi:hypothetical protein